MRDCSLGNEHIVKMWASRCRRRQQTVMLSVMVVVLSVSFGTDRCLAAFESSVSLTPNENKERLLDRRATSVEDRPLVDIDREVRDGEKQHHDKSGGGGAAKTAARRAFSETSGRDEERSQQPAAAAAAAAARKRAVLPAACCG